MRQGDRIIWNKQRGRIRRLSTDGKRAQVHLFGDLYSIWVDVGELSPATPDDPDLAEQGARIIRDPMAVLKERAK